VDWFTSSEFGRIVEFSCEICRSPKRWSARAPKRHRFSTSSVQHSEEIMDGEGRTLEVLKFQSHGGDAIYQRHLA
jgi:hypothetical protein